MRMTSTEHDTESPQPYPQDTDSTTPPASSTATKSKRVRTGCLTCRERHLKCDEGLPVCLNCKKSSRECKRGVRLNFLECQVRDTVTLPRDSEWQVNFQDESREIASGYEGGSTLYGAMSPRAMDLDDFETSQPPPSRPQLLPTPSDGQRSHNGGTPSYRQESTRHTPLSQIQQHHHQALSDTAMTSPTHYIPHTSPTHMPFGQPVQNIHNMQNMQNMQIQNMPANDMYYNDVNSQIPTPSKIESISPRQDLYTPSHESYHSSHDPAPSQIVETTTYISDPEETVYMQVFVEEVGLWMDSLDPHKHFSRILPFYALSEPMLYNAFLACGARHLTLVNPAAYQEEKALAYYDAATRMLLQALQDKRRDSVICATAAVILNVYEIMSERALQRMNHIAGARALIKECDWNAQSVGIGVACFWLNVGMEVLSCLHFNWQLAWNPDDWKLDTSMAKDPRAGQEEHWAHKMIYLTAKLANFRATIPRVQESNSQAHAIKHADRTRQWEDLKANCDLWNQNVPRSMQPVAVIPPYQNGGKSAFPEIWLIKRSSIVARLFYHSTMCLLAQLNPNRSRDDPEMLELQVQHSRQICGIVAHGKDRGVASVAIRSVAIAAECLTDFNEQCEIWLQLERIKRETGWRIDFLKPELRQKWGWTDELLVRQQQQDPSDGNLSAVLASIFGGGNADFNASTANYSALLAQSQALPSPSQLINPANMSVAAPPPRKMSTGLPNMPKGIMNPMYSAADFNQPRHPYQDYYVKPNTERFSRFDQLVGYQH